MKILAETTGPFLLIDPVTHDVAQAHRPSVISLSQFFHARIAIGQVTKLADVPEDVTDADFEAYWKEAEGDTELAVASFVSKAEPNEPAPKTTRKAK